MNFESDITKPQENLENSRSISIEEEEELKESNKSLEKSSNELEKSFNSSDLQDFSENSLKNPNTSTQMLNFFNSYAVFINEASNIVLDLDSVLAKLVEAVTKLRPPERSSPHINELWTSLQDINKKSIEQMAENLTKMPENKLYETIQDLEKLNIKLMIEYNMEVKRGKALKIINNEE